MLCAPPSLLSIVFGWILCLWNLYKGENNKVPFHSIPKLHLILSTQGGGHFSTCFQLKMASQYQMPSVHEAPSTRICHHTSCAEHFFECGSRRAMYQTCLITLASSFTAQQQSIQQYLFGLTSPQADLEVVNLNVHMTPSIDQRNFKQLCQWCLMYEAQSHRLSGAICTLSRVQLGFRANVTKAIIWVMIGWHLTQMYIWMYYQ